MYGQSQLLNMRWRRFLQLVSWCFEPSQLQRITSGLNTSFTLSSTYSCHKSSYHKSCFLAYLYSAGTQHGNLHPAGRPILFCGPTQEPCVSHRQNRKKNHQGRLWKNAGEWTGGVEKSKEEIPGSKRRHLWLYTNLLQALKLSLIHI